MTEDTHMTPKDFAPHVLAVIAELTDYQANASVPMGQTFGPVCARMGISEDFGGETPHGSKFTHRTIGLAMRQLRDRNLGKYVKKGHWGLTAAGINEARKITGVTGPEEEDTVDELAARASAAENEDLEEEDADVIPLSTVRQTHPYSDDPYIRSLAIEHVMCFGAYSKRSDACKTCPLTSDCIAQVRVRKAALAKEIEVEEARALTEAQKKQVEKAKKDGSVAELIEVLGDEEEETSSSKGGKKGKFRPAAGQDLAPAKAQRESTCIQCGEVFTIGEQVTWVAHEGLFHPNCVEDPNG